MATQKPNVQRRPADPSPGLKVYVFKRGQRVPSDHPAVRACPEAFVPLEEWVDAGNE